MLLVVRPDNQAVVRRYRARRARRTEEIDMKRAIAGHHLHDGFGVDQQIAPDDVVEFICNEDQQFRRRVKIDCGRPR